MNKKTIIYLLLITMVLASLNFIASLFSKKVEFDANYLSAIGTLLTVIITIKIAESAERNSTTSLEISKKLEKQEILNEGPALFIISSGTDDRKMNYNQHVNPKFYIRNEGNGVALNVNFVKEENMERPNIDDIPTTIFSKSTHPNIELLKQTNHNSLQEVKDKYGIRLGLGVIPEKDADRLLTLKYSSILGKNYVTEIKIKNYGTYVDIVDQRLIVNEQNI